MLMLLFVHPLARDDRRDPSFGSLALPLIATFAATAAVRRGFIACRVKDLALFNTAVARATAARAA